MERHKSEFVVVLTTCATKNEAETVATRLVSDKAAACVNIVDKITSIYEWQGKIEKAHEVLLLIKTRRDLADRVEGTIKGFSSYDCPEVIVLPVVDGAPEYLNWITDTTTPR